MSKEIKISIKNRWTGSIIFEYSSVDNTLAKTVLEALKGEADLREANLYGANLYEAKGTYMACPTDGSFIGWKKASGYIVKLQIPEDARRSSAGGEKCRCDKAFVIEIQNFDGTNADIETVCSDHDKTSCIRSALPSRFPILTMTVGMSVLRESTSSSTAGRPWSINGGRL